MLIFLSHSSEDKRLVDDLRRALELRGCRGWLDVRELLAGDILTEELKQAIDAADAFMLLVSAASLQSEWVGAELTHALKVQKRRQKEGRPYSVVPLCLDGTKLGVLKQFFKAEPLYVSVTAAAGGVEAAIPDIEAALGIRLPQVQSPTPVVDDTPHEELVLELTRPDFFQEEGVRRPRADAMLVYQPADKDQRKTESNPFVFTAPLGPIELEDLRWYLEEYAVWPGGYVDEKARRIERQLEQWGELLYREAIPDAAVREVLNAWSRVQSSASRRFNVQVDRRLPAGTDTDRVQTAKEAATALLGLPWELLRYPGRRPGKTTRPFCSKAPNRSAYGGGCPTPGTWASSSRCGRPSASCWSRPGRKTMRAAIWTTASVPNRWSAPSKTWAGWSN